MQTIARPATEGGRAKRPAPEPRRRLSRTIRLFVVDFSLVVAFVLVMDVPLTGVPIHEWLGIAFAVGLIAHVVQHTKWILTTTRRILTSASVRNRINSLMTIGLFVGFVSIIASGLLISEAALPFLGIEPEASDFWLWLHLASVTWVLWLTALHVALNWKWLVNALGRFVIRPIGALLDLRGAQSGRP